MEVEENIKQLVWRILLTDKKPGTRLSAALFGAGNSARRPVPSPARDPWPVSTR